MLNSGDMVERYKVDSLVGEGGMAKVYLVRHRQLNSLHVLKVLSITNERVQHRLVQEGRIQASLQHPNIVSVTDVLMVNGAPALLMPYVDGPTLSSWIQEFKPLPLPAIENVFLSILAGLREAHSFKLVHRDLKPSNVLLSKTVDGWVPMISDFGIAKAMARGSGESSYTHSGVPMGTPSYMAPEQINDAKDVDQRADIFALGCILYEMLTGKMVFAQEGQMNIFTAIMNEDFVPVHDHREEVPERLVEAIRGCLIADREQRIPDCQTLRTFLDAASTGPLMEPTNTGVDSWTRREGNRGEGFSDPSFDTSLATLDIAPSSSLATQAFGMTEAEEASTIPPTPRSPQTPSASTTDLGMAITAEPSLTSNKVNPWRIAAVVAVVMLTALGIFGLTQLDRLEDLERQGSTTITVNNAAPLAENIPPPAQGSAPVEEREQVAEPLVKEVTTLSPEASSSPPRETAAPIARPVHRETSPASSLSPDETTSAEVEVIGTGTLTISSVPWANVELDGAPAKVTPPWKREVSTGTHHIRLETAAGARYEGTVEVNSGEESLFCWDFQLGAGC